MMENSLVQAVDEEGNPILVDQGLGKSSTLSQMTSVLSAANELGLKFGDIPNSHTQPAFSFGSGDRESRAKLFDQGDLNKEFAGKWSPGPGTASRGMHSGRPKSPEYSFGGKGTTRNQQLKPSSEVGPAQFGPVNAVGKQISSVSSTAPDFTFSHADRDKINKLYTPGAPPTDSSTPGPVYFPTGTHGVNAVGKQVSSVKDNAPNFGFGTSKRDQVNKLYMPQSQGQAR